MRIPTRRLVAPFMLALAVALSGLPAAPSPVRAAGSITALAIDSEPGDMVGQGQQLEYAPPTSQFSVATFEPGWTFVQVLGAAGGDFWNMTLRAAGPEALAVGTYDNAQRLPDAAHPGLDIGGQGRGCNTSTGSFVISELERDGTGNVTTLAVSFEQHCEGDAAALFGELRYQASTGYPLLTVAPASIDLGSAGVGSATPAGTVHLASGGIDGVVAIGDVDRRRERGRLRHRVRELRCRSDPAPHDLRRRHQGHAACHRRAHRAARDRQRHAPRRAQGRSARHGPHAGLEGRVGNDPVGAELQLQPRPVARPHGEQLGDVPPRDLHDRSRLWRVGRRQRPVRGHQLCPHEQPRFDVHDAQAAQLDRSSTARAGRSPRAASTSTRPGSPPPAGSRTGPRRLVSSTCAATRTMGRRPPGTRRSG